MNARVVLSVALTLLFSTVALAQSPPVVNLTNVRISGDQVTVAVTNPNNTPIDATALLKYHDGDDLHEAQEAVSLAAKETQLVTITVQHIVDDGDPLPIYPITEGPDPIGEFLALGAVLWAD